jgi:glucose/arabinose dehydrogenase
MRFNVRRRPRTPVDMLVAGDGALLVLTQDSIVRFSSP